MTSILDGPDTAAAPAGKPAEPAVAESCAASEGAEAGSPPGPQPHPVVRFTESLSAGLDRLAGAAAWSMTPAEQRRVLVQLRRQQARLRELELRVLVAGDRNEIGADSGATWTPA